MFGSSTQYKYWILQGEDEISSLRNQANKEYIEKFGENQSRNEKAKHFLSSEEEYLMIRHYEQELYRFCQNFRDIRDERIRLPVNVTTTSMHYFKRFYLYNSVMDYHPKDILLTCVYLACKVEEFYVTINDFVSNIEGGKEFTAQVILNNELMLTQELQFHLIIHQPFRPLEGLFIDIKTRYPQLADPERCRSSAEEFLEKVLLTDAILLYGPSQIAVAAMTSGLSKLGDNLDGYVVDVLFSAQPQYLKTLIDAVRRIKRMVKNFDGSSLKESRLADLEKKLQKCRNPENDPTSPEYKALIDDFLDDNEDGFSEAMDTDDPMSMGVEKISRS